MSSFSPDRSCYSPAIAAARFGTNYVPGIPSPYPSFAELRRTPRLLLEAPVSRIVRDKAVAEKLINLSSTGAGLVTRRVLQVGLIEKLRFAPPAFPVEVLVEAEVVHVRRSGRPGEFEAGFRFIGQPDLKPLLRGALAVSSQARSGSRLELAVEAFWSGGAGKATGTAELLNLGLGGALIQAATLPPVGTPFILGIHPPEGHEMVALPGRIVWSHSAGPLSTAGVAFAEGTQEMAGALIETMLWTQRAEPPAAAAWPAGSRIGGFQTGALLKRGRSHEVYAATAIDPTSDTGGVVEVALRRFTGEARDVALWSEHFIAAAEVGADLIDVPGVLRVHAATSGRHDAFLATDRLEGTSFDQTLAEFARQPQPPALEPILEVMGEVLRTLHECHLLAADGPRELIHGDLRPSNVLLGSRGEVRLIGFGAAPRDLPGKSVRPPPDRLAYLAPEVFKDGGPTSASDVYQVGVMLYEAIAANPPFRASSPEHLLKLIALGPAPLGQLDDQIPATLESLVSQALSLDPAKRPTAAEFHDRLRAVALPVPIGNEPTDPRGYLQKVVERSTKIAAHSPRSLGALPAPPTQRVATVSSRRRRRELGSGEVLGRYRLLGKIAKGGMGAVYLARPIAPAEAHQTLVLKTLLPGQSSDLESIKLFLNEARVASVLNHANIVQLHDFGFDQNRPYIALDYVDGTTLAQLMFALIERGQRLPPSLAARIVSDTCKGLAHAHAQKDKHGKPMGIVHRDMSAKNILISYGGEVKVLDFGIAKFRGSSSVTQKGMVRGTVDYVAPEQAVKHPLTALVDVWAMGVNLYDLLTNTKPFAREGFAQTLLAIVHEPLKPADQVLAEVPPPLAAVAARALEKQIANRYQDATAMSADLERYLADHPAGPGELAELMGSLFPAAPNTERERLARLARGEGDTGADASADSGGDSGDLSLSDVFPESRPAEPSTDKQPAHDSASTVQARAVEVAASGAPTGTWEAVPTEAGNVVLSNPETTRLPSRRLSSSAALIGLGVVVAIAIGWVATRPAEIARPLVAEDAPVAVKEPADAAVEPTDAAVEVEAVADPGAAEVASALELSCNLPCEASLDGELLGPLPLRLATVAPGKHKLSFVARTTFGTAKKDVELTVEPDEPAAVAMTFATGTLKVSAPPGSTVFMFGKKRGRVPLRLPIIEGTHEVVVTGAKLGSRKELVKIVPGRTTTLNVR